MKKLISFLDKTPKGIIFLALILGMKSAVTAQTQTANIAFEALTSGGTLEAYIGADGWVGNLGGVNGAFQANTGRLNGGTKVEPGEVPAGYVYFVATPMTGWRVKRFFIQHTTTNGWYANRTGADFSPINDDGISSSGNLFGGSPYAATDFNLNTGAIANNQVPGFIQGVLSNVATVRTQERYPGESFRLDVAASSTAVVKVEFEKEIALYSNVTVSNCTAVSNNAFNFQPSKWSAACGSSAWWPGVNGIGEWIRFDFDDGLKNISELRLYNRLSTNPQISEVDVEFGIGNATVRTENWNNVAPNGAVATLKFGTPIAAEWMRIVTKETSNLNGNGGYQRVMIIEELGADNIPVTGITLNETVLEIEEGKTAALTATVLPENAYNRVTAWSSSDETIATVSNGIVTAKKAGTADITATTNEGGFTATCRLTVTAAAIPVVTFEVINHVGGTLEAFTGAEGWYGWGEGGLGDFQANTGRLIGGTNVAPGEVPAGNIYFVATPEPGWRVKWYYIEHDAKKGWYANRTQMNVVKIDMETGRNEDNTTVIPNADFNLGTGAVIDNSQPGFVQGITTNDAAARTFDRCPVESFRLNILPGTTATVMVEFEKELALYSTPSVNFQALSANKHDFQQSKWVFASGPGAWWGGGVGGWVQFDFDDGPKTITEVRTYSRAMANMVSEINFVFGIGETVIKEVYSTCRTEAADQNNVTIHIIDEPVTAEWIRIVTLNQSNLANNNAGYLRIQIIEDMGDDGIPVTGVTLDKNELVLMEEETAGLIATVMPAEASTKNVIWRSSNEAVATVSSKGVVTGTGPGVAEITATTYNGGYVATCQVTVIEAIKVDFRSSGSGSLSAFLYNGAATKGNLNDKIDGFTGTLNTDGLTSLASGDVLAGIPTNTVFFTAEPAYGWRVKEFIINGKSCANLVGANYAYTDGSGMVPLIITSNIAKFGNYAAEIVYDIAQQNVRNPLEIIAVKMPEGEDLAVNVVFEQELAAYSIISASGTTNHPGGMVPEGPRARDGGNADGEITGGGYNQCVYSVIAGPGDIVVGNASAENYVQFNFRNEARRYFKNAISEVRLYNRGAGNVQITQVKLLFGLGEDIVEIIPPAFTGGLGAPIVLPLDEPIEAEWLRIVTVASGGSNAGYQRIQIIGEPIIETNGDRENLLIKGLVGAVNNEANATALTNFATLTASHNPTGTNGAWRIRGSGGTTWQPSVNAIPNAPDINNLDWEDLTGSVWVRMDFRTPVILDELVVQGRQINGRAVTGLKIEFDNGDTMSDDEFITGTAEYFPVEFADWVDGYENSYEFEPKYVRWVKVYLTRCGKNPNQPTQLGVPGFLYMRAMGWADIDDGSLEPVPVTGISLNKSVTSLNTGESEQLTATFQPADATNISVIWKSADEEVVSVSADGTITAVAPGETVVTAASAEDDAFSAVCEVIVNLNDYAVTFTPIGNGTITASVNGLPLESGEGVEEGQAVAFRAVPASGYEIKEWKRNGEVVNGTASSYSIPNLQTTTEITVEFQISFAVRHKVTFDVTGGNGVIRANVDDAEIESDDLIVEGKEVVFTALPNLGFKVKEWTIDGWVVDGNKTNVYTHSDLQAPIVVRVEYEVRPDFTVNFSIIDDIGGSIVARAGNSSITNGSQVYESENVVFTAIASYGYRIKEWTYNDVIQSETANNYTVSSLAEDVTVTVEFELTPIYEVTFDIAGDVGGTLIASVDGIDITSVAEVFENKDVMFTAEPDYGYRIKGWHNDAAGNGTSAAFMIQDLTANATVTVEFELIPIYEVTFNVLGDIGGTLVASVDETDITSVAEVFENKDIVFTATPAANYRIIEWRLDDEIVNGDAATYTLSNLMASTVLTVQFEHIAHAVSFTVAGEAPGALKATVDGEEITSTAIVLQSKDIIFTAFPGQGFRIKEWRHNGVVVNGTAATYTLDILMKDETITVEFMPHPWAEYAVSYRTFGGNGTITATVDDEPIGLGELVYRSKDVVFTATPAPGFRVSEWKLNEAVIDETSTTYTLVDLLAEANVTVTFAMITGAESLLAPNLNIYPNPFTDEVRITGAEGCTLKVSDAAGAIVHIQKITNENEIIRLNRLSAGVYFFSVEKGGQMKTMKVVKE